MNNVHFASYAEDITLYTIGDDVKQAIESLKETSAE